MIAGLAPILAHEKATMRTMAVTLQAILVARLMIVVIRSPARFWTWIRAEMLEVVSLLRMLEKLRKARA
jgi:hypothetical protein